MKTNGFKIEKPDKFFSLDVDEDELAQLFKDKSLRHVTNGSDTTSVESLVALRELEFFRTDYSQPKNSFKEFQSYFEREF